MAEAFQDPHSEKKNTIGARLTKQKIENAPLRLSPLDTYSIINYRAFQSGDWTIVFTGPMFLPSLNN